MNDAALPIPAPASQEMLGEAQQRLDKVNPHLLRVTTEVQKMMMFHQYAAPVLAALAGRGDEPDRAAMAASKYADAMIALVRVRDASSHAEAADHFETTPRAIPLTPEEAKAALDAGVQPLQGVGRVAPKMDRMKVAAEIVAQVKGASNADVAMAPIIGLLGAVEHLRDQAQQATQLLKDTNYLYTHYGLVCGGADGLGGRFPGYSGPLDVGRWINSVREFVATSATREGGRV